MRWFVKWQGRMTLVLRMLVQMRDQLQAYINKSHKFFPASCTMVATHVLHLHNMVFGAGLEMLLLVYAHVHAWQHHRAAVPWEHILATGQDP